jgi:DegV family protein with EDD domain
MANVKVITDSVSGVPKSWQDQLGIIVAPAAFINFKGKRYLEGVDITNAEAYDMALKSEGFTTSAIAPGVLLDIFKKAAQSTDKILFVSVSSAMSAVFKMAQAAAELLKEDMPKVSVRVWDSKNTAGGQGLLAQLAAKAAAKGMGLDDIVKLLEASRPKVASVMLLDTLKYVYRTGRVSRMQSRFAAMLNIKPIESMSPEGNLEMRSRARSHDKGVAMLMEQLKKEAAPEPLHFLVLHAVAPQWGDELAALIKKDYKVLSMDVNVYSAIMGYASGQGCLSIGCIPEIKF